MIATSDALAIIPCTPPLTVQAKIHHSTGTFMLWQRHVLNVLKLPAHEQVEEWSVHMSNNSVLWPTQHSAVLSHHRLYMWRFSIGMSRLQDHMFVVSNLLCAVGPRWGAARYHPQWKHGGVGVVCCEQGCEEDRHRLQDSGLHCHGMVEDREVPGHGDCQRQLAHIQLVGVLFGDACREVPGHGDCLRQLAHLHMFIYKWREGICARKSKGLASQAVGYFGRSCDGVSHTIHTNSSQQHQCKFARSLIAHTRPFERNPRAGNANTHMISYLCNLCNWWRLTPRAEKNALCGEAREQDRVHGVDQRRHASHGRHGPHGETLASLLLRDPSLMRTAFLTGVVFFYPFFLSHGWHGPHGSYLGMTRGDCKRPAARYPADPPAKHHCWFCAPALMPLGVLLAHSCVLGYMPGTHTHTRISFHTHMADTGLLPQIVQHSCLSNTLLSVEVSIASAATSETVKAFPCVQVSITSAATGETVKGFSLKQAPTEIHIANVKGDGKTAKEYVSHGKGDVKGKVE
eukprot:1154080-Pelagomonas_calceolata.AAC.2